MKESKKNPRKQLERFSNVFIQLGLVLTLFIVFISLEYETAIITEVLDDTAFKMEPNYPIERPIVYVKEVLVTKVPVKQSKIELQPVVDVVDNNVNTDPVIIKPTDKVLAPLVTLKIEEVVEDEDVNKEDDPKPIDIKRVDVIPVFEGCEGLSKVESRKCFDKKMQKMVQRYFDTSLANELGLSSGKKRIFTEFLINKQGDVTEVKINAPHPKLKKETQKIVNRIPKFTPGKQNGKPVNVRYILPITFVVE